MTRKVLEIKVELDVQAVTCPGVWLCPNGKVSIQLYMLGSCIQTASREPVFPIIYHETFIFYKMYQNVNVLSTLQKTLSKEWMYVELIQWQNCEFGNILASFKTTLSELLYPNNDKGVLAGIEVDLLMEPSKAFPGIISPKIEISTRTTIEEKLCANDAMHYEPYVENPKVICSKSLVRPLPFRQRKVCHSAKGHHRQQKKPAKPEAKRELFLYRKVDDDLIARKPQGLTVREKHCDCKSSHNVRPDMSAIAAINLSPVSARRLPKNDAKWARKLNVKHPDARCPHVADHGDCPICAKYKYYFESPQETAVAHYKSSACSGCPTKSGNRSPSIERKKCGRSRRDSSTCCCCCTQEESTAKSLAGRLHEKLARTLKCPDCSSVPSARDSGRMRRRSTSPACESNCTPTQCQINEDVIADKCLEWCGSFDRFYKNFYKDKRNACDRFIAC